MDIQKINLNFFSESSFANLTCYYYIWTNDKDKFSSKMICTAHLDRESDNATDKNKG